MLWCGSEGSDAAARISKKASTASSVARGVVPKVYVPPNSWSAQPLPMREAQLRNKVLWKYQ